MKNKHKLKISISGDLGSGKSLISKKISKSLNYDRISVGDIQRKLAKEHGMSTTEFNKYMENHPEIDNEFDQKNEKLGKENNNYIFDSRMAWYFVPDSFKIHLIVDIDISSERIFNDQARVGERYTTVEETKNNILTRKKSENKRFSEKYSVDCDNFDNYDLVIDTSHAHPDEIISTISSCLEKFIENKPFNKIWLSPKRLFPMQNIRKISNDDIKYIWSLLNKSKFDHRFSILILTCENFYFIYDGHKRTSFALINHINIVPVHIVDENNYKLSGGMTACEYAKTNCTLRDIYDWEAAHNFIYKKYPFSVN